MNVRLAALIFVLSLALPAGLHASGQLEVHVIDRDTGEPLAVRMHLKNAQGKVIKPPGVPALGDHFVFYDKIVLHLPNGGYEFSNCGADFRAIACFAGGIIRLRAVGNPCH